MGRFPRGQEQEQGCELGHPGHGDTLGTARPSPGGQKQGHGCDTGDTLSTAQPQPRGQGDVLGMGTRSQTSDTLGMARHQPQETGQDKVLGLGTGT